ncbi:MAG: DUF721 domain-containing protein [Armatimonadetes bacterium]|nr:DUF721 domain-containing protein [Armatimonadota bacterium]
MRRVNEFLVPMMERMDLYQRCRDNLALQVWDDVVGPHVRRNTAPIALKGGILFVKTASSAWVSELTMGFRHIYIADINRRLGEEVVKDIRFLPPPMPQRAREKETPAGIPLSAVPLTAEQAALAEEVAAAIASDEMREVFERCMRKGMQEDERRRMEGWKPCPDCGELFEHGQRCVRCRNQGRDALHASIREVLEQAPWLSSAEVKARIPEATRVDYERAKRRLQHRLRRRLDKWASKAGENERFSGAALSQALAYCMLRTGKVPHQLAPSDVRFALGAALAPRFPTG